MSMKLHNIYLFDLSPLNSINFVGPPSTHLPEDCPLSPQFGLSATSEGRCTESQRQTGKAAEDRTGGILHRITKSLGLSPLKLAAYVH